MIQMTKWKLLSLLAMAGLLTALVLTEGSCKYVLEKCEALACQGSGIQSSNLNLCLPSCESTNWCEDMNGNLSSLDQKFASTAGGGGHTHAGTVGNGPKLPAENLNCTNSPSSLG